MDEKGWVEHDPAEILENTLAVARQVVKASGVPPEAIAAMGISNQRETVMAWDRESGEPLYNAIVWQCARARDICTELEPSAAMVKERTGLNLSPYFSAAKLSWLIRRVPRVGECARRGTLCCGTMDAWLLHRLTRERVFRTDYSNASRTQLFNIHTLQWDGALCRLYGVPVESLPEVCMSDALFGHTDLGGFLQRPIPIRGVLGDSHAALLGQDCRAPGSVKATYGTGSSVMMNTGPCPVESAGGLVTSLAWGLDGSVEYVLEGNLNYTGAVITWLRQNLGLIVRDSETEALARSANPSDHAYFVPAFTGLGAPYWDSGATGLFTGITRTTGKAELVKACLECIGYQIADLVELMGRDSGLEVKELRVDGGPTANRYLMQFQSDITGAALSVPDRQELSAMGAALAAGLSAGVYEASAVYGAVERTAYTCAMPRERRERLYAGWKRAVRKALL